MWSMLLKPLLGVAGDMVKGSIDVIKTKTETKKLLAQAEQEHIRKMAEGELEYAIQAQKSMGESWRDEWFTIILSIPLLIVFGAIFFNQPDWVAKLKEGFITLDELPDWYIWALMASIASSFGLKVSDLAIKKFKK